MNTVTLVKNKTGKWSAPTTSGNWHRIQVTSTGFSVRNGFEQTRKMTGFYYVGTEERVAEIVASATKTANGELQIAGKVIYVDQLEPIGKESPDYGKCYPYPFRHNGQDVDQQLRALIQKKAAENGVCLMQSGKPIYRRKVYTDDLNAQSVVLSPDNMDDINTFIASVLEQANAPKDAAKQAKFNELQALGAAGRKTPAMKKEYMALIEEGYEVEA